MPLTLSIDERLQKVHRWLRDASNYKSAGSPMWRKSRGRLVISRRNGVENRSVSPRKLVPGSYSEHVVELALLIAESLLFLTSHRRCLSDRRDSLQASCFEAITSFRHEKGTRDDDPRSLSTGPAMFRKPCLAAAPQ